MNIFYIDEDPKKAAVAQYDKHVVKMILESAQMLSTCHRLLKGTSKETFDTNKGKIVRRHILPDPGEEALLYQVAHAEHPSTRWVRESMGNYLWLYNHFLALQDEYTYRYDKVHASSRMNEVLAIPPVMPHTRQTPIPLCMPLHYHSNDHVESYRRFYVLEKSDRNKFNYRRNRPAPEWFEIIQSSQH